MSTPVKFTTDNFDCEMEVECSVTPEDYGNRQPNGMCERWPATVEDLVIRILIRGEAIDVTDRLPEKVLEKIEAECIEQSLPKDDGGPDPDRDRS